MEAAQQNSQSETNYKFKDLRTFGSDEWMGYLSKKYRKVFDRSETTYLRCELSFYNKLFDRENWSCTIQLKCIDLVDGKRTELCSLETTCEVKMEEAIVFVRDGWGHPDEGAYWVGGNYFWEAYIDNELVGEAKFMVNDVGRVTPESNPYFDIDYIKLFTGDYDGFKLENRTYLKKIKQETTQYIWIEARLRNKLNVDWDYELFFCFFDSTRQLKGQVVREGKIRGGKLDYKYTFDVGWGNNVPGSWKNKKYSMGIVFMDVMVAQIEFECGSEDVEGIPHLIVEEGQNTGLPGFFRTIFTRHKGMRG